MDDILRIKMKMDREHLHGPSPAEWLANWGYLTEYDLAPEVIGAEAAQLWWAFVWYDFEESRQRFQAYGGRQIPPLPKVLQARRARPQAIVE